MSTEPSNSSRFSRINVVAGLSPSLFSASLSLTSILFRFSFKSLDLLSLLLTLPSWTFMACSRVMKPSVTSTWCSNNLIKLSIKLFDSSFGNTLHQEAISFAKSCCCLMSFLCILIILLTLAVIVRELDCELWLNLSKNEETEGWDKDEEPITPESLLVADNEL
ncbi:hypothetical protein WICPIJ_003615 [Wickerhamomyces pijperi]|uniref:Transmembrane protein n=1 Tax=Wickerhamomyces pijperi TaxID=599730 RepID=A0A9P8TNJ0_WICPI|nr:hypothetical protein WICPIJ_003615 [Wickerhamomyces pijperi]